MSRHDMRAARSQYMAMPENRRRKPRPVHVGASSRIARGPGSIMCESDIRELIRRYEEFGHERDLRAAVAMYDDHHRITGAPKLLRLALWRRRVNTGAA